MKKCVIPAVSTNLLSLEHRKKGIVLDRKGKEGKQDHWYSLNATSIFLSWKDMKSTTKLTAFAFTSFSIGLVSNKKFNYKDKKFLYGDWTSVIKKSQSKQEWFAAEARIANKLPQMTKLKDELQRPKRCLPSDWKGVRNRNGEDVQCKNGIRRVKRMAANL